MIVILTFPAQEISSLASENKFYLALLSVFYK